MKPNPYGPPDGDPISRREIISAREAAGTSLPWRTRIATILAAVFSAAFTVWGATVFVATVEGAAQAQVGGTGPSLTLTGHIVFLSFGGIIGLAVGVIAVSTSSPLWASRRLLPLWTAVISAGAAFVSIYLVSWLFFAPPRELYDLLFR